MSVQTNMGVDNLSLIFNITALSCLMLIGGTILYIYQKNKKKKGGKK
jgi:hypothetical protein